MKKSALILALGAAILAACDVTAPPSAPPSSAPAAQSKEPAAHTGGLGVTLAAEFPSAYAQLPREVGGACNFDRPGIEGEHLFFSGWAFISSEPPQLADDLVIAVRSGGQEKFASPTRTERQDVADYFKNPALKSTGLSIYLKKSDVPAGAVVALYQVYGGKAYACTVTAGG